MITIEKAQIFNIEGALRGARNPMNSWHLMDSYYDDAGEFVLGEKDRDLAGRLCAAGSDHRKFLRQILVCVDITAPLYWWKEYDTYKVATTANSQSTMHKLHTRPIEEADFSIEMLADADRAAFFAYLSHLENLRQKFVKTKEKDAWYALIQMLPASYNQLRTLTMNYENLANMHHQRATHKLNEWRVFCEWIRTLPLTDLFIKPQ
ncbi:MAG: hypothetical protein FWB71_00035 [Defluviitaleaceae bacterium]|nr:hypothetical protein [Defluviitaleaceae bacterium]